MSDDLFTCVICQRECKNRWRRGGRDRHIAPVCRTCEEGSRPTLTAGTFMDRRKLSQIRALSEALLSCASIKQWEQRHGRS